MAITTFLGSPRYGCSQWTTVQAKHDFLSGYMTGYRIERVPMGSGWVVVLMAGVRRGPLVDARGCSVLEFKTIDAGIAALEAIGFVVSLLVFVEGMKI